MADAKISGLPASTTPLAGTEVLPVVQSGVTKQVAVSDLTSGRDIAANTLTASGNLVLSGAARRITGDMSNATINSRVMFQNSTANSTTLVGVIPSGTGVNAGLQFYNSSNPDSGANSIFDVRVIGTTDVRFQSTFQGSGTPLPMTFYVGGAERFRIATTGFATFGAAVGRGAPVTKAASFTLADTENWVVCNGAGSITVTFPAASSWTGREVMLKTVAAQTVVSASSNVVPLAGGSAGTAILAGTAGKWASLVSDGTNWIIMAGN